MVNTSLLQPRVLTVMEREKALYEKFAALCAYQIQWLRFMYRFSAEKD
jgi:hypothetical protein